MKLYVSKHRGEQSFKQLKKKNRKMTSSTYIVKKMWKKMMLMKALVVKMVPLQLVVTRVGKDVEMILPIHQSY